MKTLELRQHTKSEDDIICFSGSPVSMQVNTTDDTSDFIKSLGSNYAELLKHQNEIADNGRIWHNLGMNNQEIKAPFFPINNNIDTHIFPRNKNTFNTEYDIQYMYSYDYNLVAMRKIGEEWNYFPIDLFGINNPKYNIYNNQVQWCVVGDKLVCLYIVFDMPITKSNGKGNVVGEYHMNIYNIDGTTHHYSFSTSGFPITLIKDKHEITIELVGRDIDTTMQVYDCVLGVGIYDENDALIITDIKGIGNIINSQGNIVVDSIDFSPLDLNPEPSFPIGLFITCLRDSGVFIGCCSNYGSNGQLFTIVEKNIGIFDTDTTYGHIRKNDFMTGIYIDGWKVNTSSSGSQATLIVLAGKEYRPIRLRTYRIYGITPKGYNFIEADRTVTYSSAIDELLNWTDYCAFPKDFRNCREIVGLGLTPDRITEIQLMTPSQYKECYILYFDTLGDAGGELFDATAYNLFDMEEYGLSNKLLYWSATTGVFQNGAIANLMNDTLLPEFPTINPNSAINMSISKLSHIGEKLIATVQLKNTKENIQRSIYGNGGGLISGLMTYDNLQDRSILLDCAMGSYVYDFHQGQLVKCGMVIEYQEEVQQVISDDALIARAFKSNKEIASISTNENGWATTVFTTGTDIQPTILSCEIISVTPNTASIRANFTYDIKAGLKSVNYTLYDNQDSVILKGENGTSSVIELLNLSENTTYTLGVKIVDNFGNVSNEFKINFKTLSLQCIMSITVTEGLNGNKIINWSNSITNKLVSYDGLNVDLSFDDMGGCVTFYTDKRYYIYSILTGREENPDVLDLGTWHEEQQGLTFSKLKDYAPIQYYGNGLYLCCTHRTDAEKSQQYSKIMLFNIVTNQSQRLFYKISDYTPHLNLFVSSKDEERNLMYIVDETQNNRNSFSHLRLLTSIQQGSVALNERIYSKYDTITNTNSVPYQTPNMVALGDLMLGTWGDTQVLAMMKSQKSVELNTDIIPHKDNNYQFNIPNVIQLNDASVIESNQLTNMCYHSVIQIDGILFIYNLSSAKRNTIYYSNSQHLLL